MKKFTCYDCEREFHADSREDVLKQLYDHYMTEHKEIISSADEAEKKQWMERFEKDWVAAEGV